MSNLPIKSNTNLRKFVNAYYSPKFLGALAIYTLHMPLNSDLINFLSHLKLYSPSRLFKQDQFLKNFHSQTSVALKQKGGDNQNKKDIHQEICLCLQAFNIYENRFKQLYTLIKMAQKQTDISVRLSSDIYEGLISKLYGTINSISLIIGIRRIEENKGFNFELNPKRMHEFKELLLKAKAKLNLDKNRRVINFQNEEAQQMETSLDYFIKMKENKELHEKLNSIRQKYTELGKRMAKKKVTNKPTETSENSEFEKNFCFKDYERVNKKNGSKFFFASKATLTSRNSRRKETYELLSNIISNNNISIQNQLKKNAKRSSIEHATSLFQFQQTKNYKKKRMGMIKFSEPNENTEGTIREFNIIEKKADKKSQRSKKKTTFIDIELPRSHKKIPSKHKSTKSYAHIDRQSSKSLTARQQKLNTYSSKKMPISEEFDQLIKDMIQKRRRNGMIASGQLEEYAEAKFDTSKKMKLEKHKVKGKRSDGMERKRNKNQIVKISKGINNFRMPNSSRLSAKQRRTKNSVLLQKQEKSSNFKRNPQPKPTKNTVSRLLNIPRTQTNKQQSISTIRTLIRPTEKEVQIFQQQNKRKTPNKYIIQEQLFTNKLVVGLEEVDSFQQNYVRLYDNASKFQIPETKDKQVDQNSNILSWGRYGKYCNINMVKLQELKSENIHSIPKKHYLQTFSKQNFKIKVSRQIINSFNALNQHSLSKNEYID